MYTDAITLAAVADELRFLLTGARIDTIIPPAEHAIALQCYTPAREGQSGQNRWLSISAHPQLARIHLTVRKPPRVIAEPPPFVMLLRKYLEGGRIETVEQPRWERVLHIVVAVRASLEGQDAGASEETPRPLVRMRLIAEIMGRTSNIVLCHESGMILGSHKRVGADINRYRVIMPNVPYVPPPPQVRILGGQEVPRLEPTTVTAAQLALIPENGAPADAGAVRSARTGVRRGSEPVKLWQMLVRHLAGFSPLLAREAVYRTTGDSEAISVLSAEQWEELAWNIRELAALYDTHRWHPQLVERLAEEAEGGTLPGAPAQDARTVPIAFAPYVLEQYAAVPGLRIRESPSINLLIDDFYARSEWYDALEALRAPLRKVLQLQIERCRRRATALQEEQAALAEGEVYRHQAELLLTLQHEVARGKTQVTLPDLFAAVEGELRPLVTIPLDPRLDAVGNANRLFAKYHKMRRAAELLPEQSERNAVELATLEQFLTDLQLAETPEEIALVKAEIQEAGYLRLRVQADQHKAQKGKQKKTGKDRAASHAGGVPLHVRSRDGLSILVGRNSRQNEEVTFRQATGNDIWLHARGVPGAHVIIKTAGRQVPQSTLEQAAGLAAYYSQARGNSSVPVDYTLQRYVRHMKGGGPGMVIYDHERTLYARPLALT
jgi:predicted ribosome quality control (RQC) complex YloA/Tae2 family protein